MALKIRLRPQGRKNRPFYRLVVTEGTNRRDGKYVEALGWYNPMEDKEENSLKLLDDRIDFWLEHGAQLTEKAATLVKQGAPEIMQKQLEREKSQRNRLRLKRRASRKKAAS